jgi:aminopeptidase N
MWFGDLVTMRWFDDVWMKEVFANFMAAKIVNPSFPGTSTTTSASCSRTIRRPTTSTGRRAPTRSGSGSTT